MNDKPPPGGFFYSGEQMRRVITQIGQSIYEWLFTRQAQDNMVALGKLTAAVIGTSTTVSGMAVTPTSPASMQVNVAPGEIYALAALESTVYGTLPVDTTHQIVKQGIQLDTTQLTCAAPPTAGQSINYLVQASFAEQDISVDPTTGSTPVVLQFYNSSNPSQPWSGPNNSGQTSNTFRQGSVALNAKPGIAAATGSQVTPAPDAGFVGLYVVTVANGQTTIVSGNISAYPGAPILSETLQQKISKATADTLYNNLQASSVNIITASGTLAASIGGGSVILNAAGATTQTLPAASAVAAGRRIEFMNINAGTGTVSRAGSDTITTGSSSVTSLALGAGDTLTLESNGTNGWYAVGGTAQLSASTVFGGSISANGWKRLPGGLILQWGVGNFNNGGFVNSFPITFPNNVFAMSTGSNSGNPPTTLGVSPTNNGFTGFTGSAASSHYFMAIGN
ncbi:hypothetical protein Herbaro_09500 [Herbaspirillum sp. WKF16]|uniref:gp53-like domain-containing protein n=1 Tax=Herbaspirillum sp. WKF16 TaxID=3028312 RepID=UPI0023A91F6D|nr:hypothetical protein [Herbaspirillum sp. WKF16]WDZ97995.1 hypothetical protein Herbaro_09500 [Herbaspirillum sp. WKF16]